MSFLNRRRWFMLALGLATAIVLCGNILECRYVAHTDQRAKEMQYILLAIRDHVVDKGVWPVAIRRDELGRPTCSWRRTEHPYVWSPMSSTLWDLPWFSTDDLLWLAKTDRNDRLAPASLGSDEDHLTWIAAVTGPGTVFPDDYPFSGEVPHDTIVLIEYAGLDSVFSQPGDVDVRQVTSAITQGGDGRGVHVGFADGSVWYLDKSVPFEHVNHFLTIEGARQHDRDELLGPFRFPR
jgi:hypothetical protein